MLMWAMSRATLTSRPITNAVNMSKWNASSGSLLWPTSVLNHFTSANRVRDTKFPKELSNLKPSCYLMVNCVLEARTTHYIQRRRSGSICLVGLSTSCMLRRSLAADCCGARVTASTTATIWSCLRYFELSSSWLACCISPAASTQGHP